MKLMSDGTLVVAVDDATKVTRVLVEDEQKNGCLYYADRPQGEWIEECADNADFISWRRWRCSVCDVWQTYGAPRYCPNCGARMKGADDE